MTFRSFVISQLTQSSTWIGLAIILVALLLPTIWTVFLGILILVTQDAHLQKIFAGLKAWIESVWTP